MVQVQAPFRDLSVYRDAFLRAAHHRNPLPGRHTLNAHYLAIALVPHIALGADFEFPASLPETDQARIGGHCGLRCSAVVGAVYLVLDAAFLPVSQPHQYRLQQR
jgi:hypothetical protein